MVIEVRQTTPSSLEVLQGWRRHRHMGGEDKLALHSLDPNSHVDCLSEIPRFSSPEAALQALLEERSCPTLVTEGEAADLVFSCPVPGGGAPGPAPGPAPQAAAVVQGDDPVGSFTFSQIGFSSIPLGFPAPVELPFDLMRGVKRYRHGLDVDGPNTADLSCKKRRLRDRLITSRLSQPFSQPATHILNREGLKSGDKRFLKMATSIDTARRIAHLHATSFLRFSIMNRLRKRLGLGRPGVVRMAPSKPGEDEIDTTSKAPWQPQSLQDASGGKYLRPSTGSTFGGSQPAASPPPGPERGQIGVTGKQIVAVVAKAPATCRLSKPAALPRPSADAAAVRDLTSPRIHPVGSPELRPLCTTYDDLEEDSFAWLHPEDDGAGDITDDPEHVYSDFSVIFGGGAASDATSQSEEHSYEEYLDELDGITWVTG